jgi:hypothetical protein
MKARKGKQREVGREEGRRNENLPPLPDLATTARVSREEKREGREEKGISTLDVAFMTLVKSYPNPRC